MEWCEAVRQDRPQVSHGTPVLKLKLFVIEGNALNLYNRLMTDISKFIADVQRIVKRDRQNNSGKVSFDRISKDLKSLFCRMSGCPGSLPGSVYYYWESEYISVSAEPQNEPTEEHLNKLAGMLAFLNSSDEYDDFINDDDWNEISALVGDESEDLPIDVLQDLMKVLVSKSAY